MSAVAVESDLFDISTRIKAVDGDLFLCFDTQKKRFELHNYRFRETFQAVVPYDRLDFRTVKFAYETHVKNRAAFIAALDADNAAAERRETERVKSAVTEAVERAL